MNFLAKRRKEKAEKKMKKVAQHRARVLEELRTKTEESLRTLREIRDRSPKETRAWGKHQFHYNTSIYRIQNNYIIGKIREAEIGSGFDFTLEDIDISKAELYDIWLAAVRADIIVDGPEFGLIFTER